jgi:membrane associated rhomboid family serine protease
MSTVDLISLVLIAVTGFTSYKGFRNRSFMSTMVFDVEKILVFKDYKRMFTSGLVHNSWLHFIFNAIALYFFSTASSLFFNVFQYLFIVVFSLFAGNILALYIHRHHSDYSAAGMSGAVNGIIFAVIALSPSMSITLFPIPIGIPAWVYGAAFMLFTLYGIRNKQRSIGHEAHLGGAVAGMLVAFICFPQQVLAHPVEVALVLLPAIAFIILIVYKPSLLLLSNSYKAHQVTIDHRYNLEKRTTEQEIDRILDKINRRGMKSLSDKEKKMLKQYAESTS